MNVNSLNFPFGQPLQKVQQQDRTPKRVFVLGVYASAVHARWVGTSGREIVKALAVASEPYIFWRGEGAREIIEKIRIPAEIGTLEPAHDMFSGPSGVALDERILKPIGLNRSDAWLCDLVPYSCINDYQHAAILREYRLLQDRFDLPQPSVPRKPPQLADESRRREILTELRESKASVLILLGDEPIKWFLESFEPRWTCLRDFVPYGELHPVVIDDIKLNVLPLVHPRQAAKLGRYSHEWFMEHEKWRSNTASDLMGSKGL